MLRSTLILASMAVFTTPALAGTFTVETAAPVAAGATIIAEKAVWTCQDTTCVADLKRNKATVRSCKKVAKEIGELTAFKAENSELTAEEIAVCNKAAKR